LNPPRLLPNPVPQVAPYPLRVAAVIDVGSTAIRMEVAELQVDGTARVLDSLQQPVHLGKDTFTKGRIQQSTIEECVKILKGYRRVMQEYGVTEASQIRAVATSAVREAANRDTFLDRVYMATRHQRGGHRRSGGDAPDLPVHAEPAAPGIRPCKKATPWWSRWAAATPNCCCCVRTRVSYSNTFRLGTLRMRETLDTQHARAQRTLATSPAHPAHRGSDQAQRAGQPAPLLIAPSGDARFAATQLLPDWQQQQAARLEVKNFAALAKNLAPFRTDELVRKYRVTYQEAETVGPP
jgi:exopolyphosphatase/guanosine-5'-triphosphate,3'-diphosphate pyrophosphatase